MNYTQENRLLAIETPLGKDVLLLTGFSGTEGISRPFSFELDLISQRRDIQFKDIVGKNVSVSITLADGNKRHFHGLISRFSLLRGGGDGGSDPRFTYCTATMVPWLWLLTRTANSRIFQGLSVPDIVQKIFDERGLKDRKILLDSTYEKRDYCVQYRETDFNFVCRLLEEEGIFYFFEHEEKKHTLVLADSNSRFKECPLQKSARYQTSAGAFLEEDTISGLQVVQEIKPGKYTLKDYNFETPGSDLKIEVPSKYQLGPGEREVYDYPGLYTKRSEGDRLTNLRMQEQEAEITTVAGTSNCRAFATGYHFVLNGYFRADLNEKPYVLASLSHDVTQSFTTGGGGESFAYANSFTSIPLDVPYRPPRHTPKPVVEGAQTAIVVGPAGEEIYTDKHGRVKVKFHWDRDGQRNENSSCWIRVSQLWAGSGWGAMYIPRIGHEVIVDFLEGDPDRPIVIGRVYHGTNQPPYPLPAEKTKTAIKSDSSIGGGGFNEIRFEDKKGEEQIFVHAERNQDIRIKSSLYEWIGNESHLIVKKDKLELVEADKHLSVKGDHNEKVDGTISIQAGADMQEKVGMKHALDAGMEIHLKSGMKVVIEAGMQVTLKGPGGFVDIGPAGVTIQGTLVNINSGGAAGAGSGSSPEDPKLPQEAATAKPGERARPGAGSASPAPAAPSAQAMALKSAADSGTPFCQA